MNRDPRINPRPKDVLRFGSKFGGTYIEVLTHDPKFFSTDISYINSEGIEKQLSIAQWRAHMQFAEVIRTWDDSVIEVETTETLDAILDKITRRRLEIVDEFCKAYLAETQLKPDQVVLIQQTGTDLITKWWFEKK